MSKQSIFWELTHNHSVKKSYLLGTMHTMDEDVYQYVEPYIQYMDEVSRFYSEMDLGNPPLVEEFADVFQLKNGDLEDLIGSKKYRKARKIILKSADVDIDTLRQFKPFYVSNMIAMSFLGSQYSLSLDQFLYNVAMSKELVCGGVETASEQMETGKNLDLEHQVKSFNDMWRNISKISKKVKGMKKVYLTGDINKLYKLSKRGLGPFREVLLYSRNLVMAERIANFSRDKASYFAIGAAHLGGNKGVLKYLKNHGVKAKPITF